MRTIVVDDEPWAIRNFQRQCESQPDLEIVGAFTNPIEALEFAKTHPLDFAVLDIDMPLMDGLTLGTQLRSLYPEVVLVYITAYEQYANAALRQKADYFFNKALFAGGYQRRRCPSEAPLHAPTQAGLYPHVRQL